jgi:hypothetical protein
MGPVTSSVGIVILFFLFIFIVAALSIFLFIFWILMIVDCAKRKFKDDSEKIVWIIILAFLNWLGAAIYYFAVKKNSKK